MGKRNDIAQHLGNKFGMLTINQDLGMHGKYRFVLATCECGTVKKYYFDNIYGNKSTSCGCITTKRISTLNRRHGLTNTMVHTVYSNMVERCSGKGSERTIRDYYQRGIRVCDEWKNDFKVFYDWAILNGYEKGLSIDRIDNNGNYEPGNCRFVTNKVQSRNKRNTKYVIYNGEKVSVPDLAEVVNISYSTLRQRIFKLNWTIEKAVMLPVQARVV